MKVVDDLINKISTMNLKTVPRRTKSEEVRVIESHMAHAKQQAHHKSDVEQRAGEELTLGAYDNSLGDAIAPKITAVTRTQRRDAQSWSLGRYQAVSDTNSKLPILAHGSEAEFKTLSGKNMPTVRSSQCGMAAMSWDIKEQVLNRYALTASEQLSRRNSEYYSNCHSLAEQAAAEYGVQDEFAEDCNSAESEFDSFDPTMEVIDYPRIVCPLDDREPGNQLATPEPSAQRSAEIIDFYRNRQERVRQDQVAFEESNSADYHSFNEFEDSIEELENSLSEGDLADLPLSEFGLPRRPGMDDEPALLTLEPFEPKAVRQESVEDWDDIVAYPKMHPSESSSDDYSSIDVDKTDVNRLIELAQSADTPSDVLERIARSSDFNVRWAIAGNPNTPNITIWLFVADTNPAIRYLVADSSLVSSEVLEVLSEDPDPYVSARAIKTLNRLRTRKLVKAQFGGKPSDGTKATLQSTGTDGRSSELRLKAVFSRLRELE